jgi:hypothetical protein
MDVNLKFNHSSQQSFQKYLKLNQTLLQKKEWNNIEALRMAHLLVVQAHPVAQIFLDRIRSQVASALIQDKIEYLWAIHRYIQKFEPWSVVQQKPLVQALYDLHVPIYHLGDVSSRNRILVIFDTIYNAFGVSNLVLYAILKAKGYSFLLLKDPSLACYMRGVQNWGSDLTEMAQKINDFAQRQGHQSIRIIGYSSAGYASCYISSALPCEKYLGFSIASDLSVNSSLPLNWLMTPELRQSLHSKEFVNLRERVAESDHVLRRFVAGALWRDDILHVDNLRGLNHVEIDILEKTFHDTPLAAIRYGKFDEYIEWLMN